MGEAYRGLTIMFKADGSKVTSALKSMTGAARQAEAELRMMKRALNFDGTSARAAQAQMKLLAEKASAVKTETKMIERQLKELGKTEFGGVRMEKLAESTRDAATQASQLKERYTSVTSELATQYRNLRKIAEGTRGIKKYAAAFKGKDFLGHDMQEVALAIDKIGKKMGWSAEKIARQKASIKDLRTEFKAARREYEQMSHIAEYQSFSNHLIEEATRAKAAVKELATTAKTMRSTEASFKIAESHGDVERLTQEINKLKAAMRLDPSNFDLATQHAEMLRAKLQSLENESKDLKAELRELASTSGVVEAAADAQKLETNLREARAEVDRLAEGMTESGANVNALRERVVALRKEFNLADTSKKKFEKGVELVQATNQLNAEESAVKALSKQWDVATEKVEMYNKATRYNATSNQIALNASAAAGIKKDIEQPKKSRIISSSAFTSMGMQMYSTLYPAAMMAGHYMVESASDIDAAYRDVRKTVQGSDEDFEKLLASAKEFSHTHYTGADELLEIESIAGQLGIPVENLEAFSKTVADLGIATDEAFDTESISLWLGKMSNIMHISADNYDNFADSLVRLGNSEPALESDIANITARYAGMASIVGMAPDEILAISTAATATGQKAEAAGGSLMRILGKIESATAGVSEGMRNLDDVTEEDIEEFEKAKNSLSGYAEVADMSSEEFARSWKRDPTQTFQKFVNGLKRIKDEGGSVEHTLKDVLGFGSIRDRQLLNGLTQTTDVLADSLSMSKNAYNGISDVYGDAGDAAREAEKKVQGFSGLVKTTENILQHFASEAGESLTGPISFLNGVLGDLVNTFGSLNPAVQTALTTGFIGSAAIGPLFTGIGAGMNMLESARAGIEKFSSAENTLARIQGSTFLATSRAGRKFQEYSNTISEGRREITRLTEEMKANPVLVPQNTREIQKNQGNIGTAEKGMRKESKRIAGMSAGMSALKGVGAMAGIAAGIAGLDFIIEKVSEYQQKVETFKAATDGLRDSAKRMSNLSSEISSRTSGMTSNLDTDTRTVTDFKNEMEQATQSQAEFADSIDSRLSSSAENAALADFWADRVISLSESFTGAEGEIEVLKDAVANYNSITGESLSVIDELSGKLSENTEMIRANADAYKEAMLAKAFADVAQESAQKWAENTVQVEAARQKLTDMQKQRDTFKAAGPTSMSEQDVQFYNDQMLMFDKQIKDQEAVVKGYEDMAAADKELMDQAYKSAEAQKSAAHEAQKRAEKEEKLAKSVKTYNKALKENGIDDDVSFSSMAQGIGIAEDKVDEFAASLYEASINADQLAVLGTNAFSRLYTESGGDLDAILEAINLVRNTDIPPKDITVNDEGVVQAYGHVIDLENMTVDNKEFWVNDDGSVETEDGKITDLKGKLDRLGATTANPKINVTSNADSVVADSNAALNRADGKTVHQYIKVHTVKTGSANDVSGADSLRGDARGGVYNRPVMRIPAYAMGGINGIATRTVLTQNGLIGEDGTEAVLNMGRSSAIVPLSNKRYVRPFARAVASEMPGGSQPATVINKNYSVNGMTLAKGSDGARALEALFDALRIEEAS